MPTSAQPDRFEVGRRLLGRHLRSLRQQRGMLQQQLCDAVGISAGYLSDIERGNKLPQLELLVRIADALDLLVIDLLAEYPFGSATTPTQVPAPASDSRRRGAKIAPARAGVDPKSG